MSTRTERAAAPDPRRSSARLGLTLRSMLVSPSDGFAGALAAAERRDRTGRHPREGLTPYVLAALSGAAMVLLWLKLGGLLGVRQFPRSDYRSAYLFASLGLGAVLGLAAQALWGHAALGALRLVGVRAKARDLRLVWGAAGLPQVIAFTLLLPLDLLIAGPGIFTTERLSDDVATAWAALSIAGASAFAAWSVYLLVRGVQVIGGTSLGRAALGALSAPLVLFSLVAVVRFAALILVKGAGNA